MKKLKVLDLFSGIGGFSLGLERAGFETIAFCEIEKYPQRILKKHWPELPIAEDIKKLSYNFKTKQLFYKTKVIYVGTIELICGGFPCQPFSVAGKQKGKTVANSGNTRLQMGKQRCASIEKTRASRPNAKCGNAKNQFRPIEPPTQPPVRHRDDGLPDNVARLKALGNAVVPQIPELIGRAIMSIENQ